jgi:phosphoglycerate dehydrogenase-like enzyme
MLSLLRKIPQFDNETRGGRGWSWPIERQGTLGEINGRTVGLVGYGATAGKLAPILAAIGANILYTAPHRVAGAHGAYVTLDDLLAKSDIVSLHLPLNETTRGVISRDRIARMKGGSILINTARGGLVDQTALADALRSGHLSAAGLDTFAMEPVEPGNPLLTLNNVVATPHVAWLTLETFNRSFDLMAENCHRLANGKELINRVV